VAVSHSRQVVKEHAWEVSVHSLLLKTVTAVCIVGSTVPAALASAIPNRSPTAPSAVASPAAPVVTIAGDIATSSSYDTATAALVRRIDPDYALTAGDNAYPYGSQLYYLRYYDSTWGTFKARTRPAPGNHDYSSEAGSPPYYYSYFAEQLPDRNRGRYYAFNLGSWRLYSLNCEISCGASSRQVAWLRNDLATAGVGRHKLAYLHRPRYSCGTHGSDTAPDALWDRLIAARADLVVAGHDHNYQRFPRMNSNNANSATGLMSFVVGTGGASQYPITGDEKEEGCRKARYVRSGRYGVLKLTLRRHRFRWAFVAANDEVLDSGVRRTLD
jgi:hypothetical protein